MSIIRVHRKPDSFTVIDNRIVRDERLSMDALGLLVYLLSKPRNWEVRADDLRERFSTGKHKPYTVLQELQVAGYAYWTRDRTGKTTWDIFDEPQPENRDEEPKQTLMPLDPYPENRDKANPHPENRDKETGQGIPGEKPHPENREEGVRAPHPENRDVLVSTERAVNTEKEKTSSSTAVEVLEYRSAKGKILKGLVLDRFERFWCAFDYKDGKAATADAWLKVERLYGPSRSLDWFHQLLAAARAEAKARSQTSKMPKMAQGWLNERRFEDYRAQAGGPADAAAPKAWFETWSGVCEMAATRYGILDIEFGDPAGKMTELIRRMKERGDEIPAHLLDWHRSMTEAAA